MIKTTINKQYLPVIRQTFCISLILIIPSLNDYGLHAILLSLCIYSLISTAKSIQALSIASIIRLLNPSLFYFDGTIQIIGWALILISALRISIDFFSQKLQKNKTIYYIFAFSAVVILETFITSEYPSISLTKLFSFFIAVTSLVIGFNITIQKNYRWDSWFISLWSSIIIISIPTLFFKSIGYYRDEMGFQGILNHPQAFAVCIAPISAWIIGKFLNEKKFHKLLNLSLLFLIIYFIYLTRARTAIVAILISLCFLSIYSYFFKKKWRDIFTKKSVHPLFLSIAAISLIIVFSNINNLSSYAEKFIFKNMESISISESFEKSRGFLIRESINNFSENYLFGIGFGVSKSQKFSFEPVIEPYTGIPISAPTEKPNIFVAVLEETGIIGSFFFIILISNLFKQILSTTEIQQPLVFFTCFFTNIGETTFFSIGGLGLYLWIIMIWQLSFKYQK